MQEALVKIKRLIISGRYVFTRKAENERIYDGLTQEMVLESILNAICIEKTVRSRSRHRQSRKERLYVIESQTYDGILVYTKGAIKKEVDGDMFYLLVSSKRSIPEAEG